jgi:hypothetical protein
MTIAKIGTRIVVSGQATASILANLDRTATPCAPQKVEHPFSRKRDMLSSDERFGVAVFDTLTGVAKAL